MKMSWRKVFYILLSFGALVVFAALYLKSLIQAVPVIYEKELKRPLSTYDEPLQAFLEVVDDIEHNLHHGDDLDYEVTQEQLNGWLATQLKGNSRVSVPSGIESPRVILEGKSQTIYFTIVRPRFHSVISLQLETRLADQPNAIELKIESVHAGSLPIRLKRIFDEIESAMIRSGVDFKWKAGTERTVAIIHIPSKVRTKRERELQITALEFQTGSVRVTAEVD
ncbi:hypothetical protein OAI33_06515 [Pirellulaceae bacterium]|nr:hypothetical protein [Pirellulaceae bacterium]